MPHFRRHRRQEPSTLQQAGEFIEDKNLQGAAGAGLGALAGAGLGYGAGKLRNYANPDDSGILDVFTEGPSALVDDRMSPQQMALWGAALGTPLGKEIGSGLNETKDEKEQAIQNLAQMAQMRQLQNQARQSNKLDQLSARQNLGIQRSIMQEDNEDQQTKESQLNRQKQAEYVEGLTRGLNEYGINPDEFVKQAQHTDDPEVRKAAALICQEYGW